jgi:non-canonical (house-cleaning) NTP pyrophosphatase
VRGARNRAAAAHRESACDFGVGIEDGLVEVPLADGSSASHHVNIGCAAITDGRSVSLGFTSGFAYPPEVSLPAVRDREPIGELFDRLWRARRGQRQRLPSARTTGNVGKLTGGVLPRSEYARHAVVCALVAFLNPDLYADSGARR